MKMKTSTLLKHLEKLKNVYGGDAAAQKLDLLKKLTPGAPQLCCGIADT
jgi:hypothetical protein